VIFIPLTVVRVTVVLKEHFLRWRSKLQDNARPHTAEVAMDALIEIGGTPLEHLPYSPDLAPCDFWAFPTMKREL
jgi:histone-lysine N-methyltransferase SETMAR